jgi:hypothetical protein
MTANGLKPSGTEYTNTSTTPSPNNHSVRTNYIHETMILVSVRGGEGSHGMAIVKVAARYKLNCRCIDVSISDTTCH